MNEYLNFNSRETYLESARQWKTDYANISKEIRATKKKIANECREKGWTWAWLELSTLRAEANQLLGKRWAMKEEAGRQMATNTNRVLA